MGGYAGFVANWRDGATVAAGGSVTKYESDLSVAKWCGHINRTFTQRRDIEILGSVDGIKDFLDSLVCVRDGRAITRQIRYGPMVGAYCVLRPTAFGTIQIIKRR